MKEEEGFLREGGLTSPPFQILCLPNPFFLSLVIPPFSMHAPYFPLPLPSSLSSISPLLLLPPFLSPLPTPFSILFAQTIFQTFKFHLHAFV